MDNSSPNGDPRCIPFLELKSQAHAVGQLMDGEQAQIPKACAQLNHLFQSQVHSIDWEDWPAQRRSLLNSIRVEMHKQLRLLATDLMFFKAAKQMATLEQRQRDIGDRLTNLQGYCDAIIKLANETDPSDSTGQERSRLE